MYSYIVRVSYMILPILYFELRYKSFYVHLKNLVTFRNLFLNMNEL